jgi:hypothetical protein
MDSLERLINSSPALPAITAAADAVRREREEEELARGNNGAVRPARPASECRVFLSRANTDTIPPLPLSTDFNSLTPRRPVLTGLLGSNRKNKHLSGQFCLAGDTMEGIIQCLVFLKAFSVCIHNIIIYFIFLFFLAEIRKNLLENV